MVGYGGNRGIVPIACDEIFKRVNANDDVNLKYEVQFSMLEIYNEKVQDLLSDPKQKPPAGGLKVRESASGAVYVQGLSKHPVDSYDMIDQKMEEGYSNRSIGSTLMNQTSSRAHTIITIEFKQIKIEGNQKLEKFSVINLVDLAGSEKAGQTGAEGQRLKEGCAINKSLTVLGTCISVLADKAMGKEKKTVVPYRDSALTRILQNALGGNSKTIMICAISPASINYEESVSTLRYADRAKKIQNKAVVNESAQDKLIRELRSENAKLKEMLMKAAAGGGTINLADLGLGSAQDVIESLDHAEQALEEMEKPFEQKLAEQKAADAKREEERQAKQKLEDPRAPHLTNLNEDPQLSQGIYYRLADFPVRVGRRNEEPKPQIIFGSVSVHKNHGQFTMLPNGLIQFAATCREGIEQTLINGKHLPQDNPVQVLGHLDTVYFGPGAMLLFKFPLMKRTLIRIQDEIQQEQAEAREADPEAEVMDSDEIAALAYNRLMEQGVGTDDLTQVICEDYSEEEIKNDRNAVDWEQAQEEVDRVEEQRKQAQLEAIKEQERLRLEQAFLAQQQADREKEEQLIQQLRERERLLEEERLKREEELRQQEEEARKQLQIELEARDRMLAESRNQQEASQAAVQREQEAKAEYEKQMEAFQQAQREREEKMKEDMAQAQVEFEIMKKQMQQERERHQKMWAEQQKAIEAQA